MRKILWIAFLILTVPFTPNTYAQPEDQTFVKSPDLEQVTLEQICLIVSCETGLCIAEVSNAYAEGRMEVQKEAKGYRVTVLNGGSIIQIIIGDEL